MLHLISLCKIAENELPHGRIWNRSEKEEKKNSGSLDLLPIIESILPNRGVLRFCFVLFGFFAFLLPCE